MATVTIEMAFWAVGSDEMAYCSRSAVKQIGKLSNRVPWPQGFNFHRSRSMHFLAQD